VRAQDLVAGPEHEMECIAEHDVRAQAFELLGRHRLDGAVGSDRHECGRLDRAMREREAATAGGARRA
jgi:hypothetical protein